MSSGHFMTSSTDILRTHPTAGALNWCVIGVIYVQIDVTMTGVCNTLCAYKYNIITEGAEEEKSIEVNLHRAFA